MGKTSKEIGKDAEEFAVKYLVDNGYVVLHQNWYFKHKEIDIVCKKDDQLIIVEVKYRGKNNLQSPSDSVTKAKQRFLVVAANAYIEKYSIDLYTRFDILSILTAYDGTMLVNHMKDAFYPIL